MLTVHHLGVSQSERIVWLCEELGIAYTLVRTARDPITRLAPAEYRALHPLGTAPIITDGQLALAESGAIVEYIIAIYGNGALTITKDQPGFAEYLFWFHFANGSLMPSAMAGMVASAFGPGHDNPIARLLQARLENGFDMIERRLGQTDYLAGDALTAADIMTVFALTTMRNFAPHDLSQFPNTRAYLARIGARPAYQRAMAKAEPDMAPMLR